MSMMNRLANSSNRFQGSRKRVLCVCSAGLLRSPTAAVVLAQEFNCNTRSAGLSKEFALIAVDDVLLNWADEIVCFENWQGEEIAKLLKKQDLNTEVCVLDIPDKYEYMDPELVDAIKEAYSKYR